MENLKTECSFCKWYPKFDKNSLEAVLLTLPDKVCKYIEDDAFLLPIEATTKFVSSNSEWSDGSAVNYDAEEEVNIFFFHYYIKVIKIVLIINIT